MKLCKNKNVIGVGMYAAGYVEKKKRQQHCLVCHLHLE